MEFFFPWNGNINGLDNLLLLSCCEDHEIFVLMIAPRRFTK